MSLSRLALLAVCAVAIGFGFIESSRSQGMMGQGTGGTQGTMGQGMMAHGMMAHAMMMMGKYVALAGSPVSGNVSSVWLLDSSDKQIIACKYQLDAGTIACAKQALP